MKLPRIIQKWIRKQFNTKTVCNLCLEPYEYQTKEGEFLCAQCGEERRNNIRSQAFPLPMPNRPTRPQYALRRKNLTDEK